MFIRELIAGLVTAAFILGLVCWIMALVWVIAWFWGNL